MGGRGPSRAEEAADRVARWADGLEPGVRLGTKEQVRAECGVSVGTFNVALRLLQERGVVVVRPGPGGGLFVPDGAAAGEPDAAALADAFRVRGALEPLIIEDALWHGSPADLADLRARAAELAAAADRGDGAAFVRANWRLHARIAAIAQGDLLRTFYLRALEVVQAHTMAFLPHGEPVEGFLAARSDLHLALVDALERRDRDAALRIAREHDEQI
ncbi:GntR family transcriptional regulator [Actinomadura atramentaria]|uniref:GntR family transcriptional regulator n=1 Tax=Actinomadura atramentaria TaxID=1990 RepID=UPI00036ABE9A|nr:FCD domain-containing protein [Actinomadura atramentaria]